MEERIQKIQESFQKDYKEFIQQSTPSYIDIDKGKTEEILKTKKKTIAIPKNAHPLMMNKINKYKIDLGKNNLKKQQNVFICDGTIDDFEKELGIKSV